MCPTVDVLVRTGFVARYLPVLFPLLPNWYLAAVGLFVFDLTMWTMAVGMAVITDRFIGKDESLYR